MTWMLWLGAVVLLLILIPYLLGRPNFWNTIQRHPEEAWAWFHLDPTWMVADDKPSKEYTGPFKVLGGDGAMTNVFALSKGLEASQALFLKRLSEVRHFEKTLGRELKSESALEELRSGVRQEEQKAFMDWLSTDPVSSTVARGLSPDDFREIYGQLLEGGCGQLAGGRWAPVAIMTNPRMLQAVLEAERSERATVAIRLVHELG